MMKMDRYSELDLKENINLLISCTSTMTQTKNIPTHEALLSNLIYKEVRELKSASCVNNKANHNLTPSHKK